MDNQSAVAIGGESPTTFSKRAFEAGVGDAIAVVEPPSVGGRGQDIDGSVTRLWGCPETGLTHASTGADTDSDRHGEPLPGVETRVLDDSMDGELLVSGPATMNGYISRPAFTDEWVTTLEETRWIRTGLAADSLPTRAEVSCVDNPMESIHDRSHS